MGHPVRTEIYYEVSQVFEDEQHVKFTGWWDDIVVTGVVPFLALVFFNLQIYCKIR